MRFYDRFFLGIRGISSKLREIMVNEITPFTVLVLRGIAMLGLFGLLGALFAGVLTDSVMRIGSRNDDDDANSDQADDNAHTADPVETHSIFSMFGLVEGGAVSADAADTGRADIEENGMPLSDDNPDQTDPDLVLTGGLDADNLNGNDGNDYLSGAQGDDFLGGRGGDDVLDGGDGEDHLYAGEGTNALFGGAGRDVMHAGVGDDKLDGGDGNDALFGHDGDDALAGGGGDDSLLGGDGFDSLTGEDGADALDGGYGRDLLAGGPGSDTLDGGDGNDTIWGQGPDAADTDTDFLNGGDGDDLLMLGASDYGHGGNGADVFGLFDIGPNDPPMQITDFNPAQDALVVFYDASLHPDPQLTLETDMAGAATRLLLDGVTVANLSNVTAIDLGAITLRAA